MTDLSTIVAELEAAGLDPTIHTILDDDVGDALITTPDSTMKHLYVAAEGITYRVDMSYCSCGNGRQHSERDITLSNHAFHRQLHQESCEHQVAALNSPMEGQGRCQCGATTVSEEPMHDQGVYVMDKYYCNKCDTFRFMV
jgi:hypothetical protein